MVRELWAALAGGLLPRLDLASLAPWLRVDRGDAADSCGSRAFATPLDEEAERRADQMLRDHLGEQYQWLIPQGYLDVPSRMLKNTVYRLRLRRPIEMFRNGRRQPWRLCIVSVERVPAADQLVMKLLWLKTNEEYIMATANRVR